MKLLRRRPPDTHWCFAGGKPAPHRECPDSHGRITCPSCGQRVHLIDSGREIETHWVADEPEEGAMGAGAAPKRTDGLEGTRAFLAMRFPKPELSADGQRIHLRGFPVSGVGATPETACDDFVAALRRYTEHQLARSFLAVPGDAFALTMFVYISDDETLRRWARGETSWLL